LIMPVYDMVIKKRSVKIPLKLTKSNLHMLIALGIFLVSLFVYSSGAFSYPWLEDDDPWHHAAGMKYIAVEKDVFHASGFMYVNPYPPGYDLLFGVLHQTSTSLHWTMKFFNALIVSLSILFFYLLQF